MPKLSLLGKIFWGTLFSIAFLAFVWWRNSIIEKERILSDAAGDMHQSAGHPRGRTMRVSWHGRGRLRARLDGEVIPR
jgi:hypothetical protein